MLGVATPTTLSPARGRVAGDAHTTADRVRARRPLRAARARAARRPAPQQTLAASIDWSHGLLAEQDRVVFRRLAVFVGGFDLEDARAVCAGAGVGRDDVLGALGRLVDKSLVLAEHRRGHARYRPLETMRQYAGNRLHDAGEASAIRDRHVDRYLAVTEDAEPELDRDKDAWREPLEVEHDNLGAALDWGLAAEDPERGRRLAAGLAWRTRTSWRRCGRRSATPTAPSWRRSPPPT
jgi:predicted ATPase